MIAFIRGILTHKSPQYVIVEVNGIGYQVFTSLQSFYHLPDVKESVALHTYTHLREDALQLYGFLTSAEREIFLLLLNVSGIGPRSALNILSGLSVEDLVGAIQEGDLRKLTSVPGIGAKTAGRLALELKDRLTAFSTHSQDKEARPSPETQQHKIMDDAISALVNLGYHRQHAKEVVKKICGEGPDTLTVEEVIRTSLRTLSK